MLGRSYCVGPVIRRRIADYRYNALHWRVRKVSDTSETLDCPADDSTTNTTPLTSELDQRRDLYYDASWRLIHEEIDDDFHPTSLATAEGTGGGTEGDTFNLTRVGQILWGVRYIDDAVMRQVSAAFTDTPAAGEFPPILSVSWDDAIDEEEGRTAKRWWYLTDVQFSVVGLIDPTWGSMVTERVEYSPYGVPLYQPATDFDGDGDVDVGDESAFLDSWYAQFGGSGIGPGPASADRDRSGAVDVGDLFDFLDAWFADFPVGGPGAPEGWISRKEVPPSMGVQDGPLGPDNPVGYCGYINNPETGDYTVRFRHYSPRLGRWLERDPAGYVDGINLYQYALTNPTARRDPSGRISITPGLNPEERAVVETLWWPTRYCLWRAKEYALKVSKELGGGDGNKADAVRHCVFSCSMAHCQSGDKGIDLAKRLGDAHEYGSKLPGGWNDQSRRLMDLHNNAWGRRIAQFYKDQIKDGGCVSYNCKEDCLKAYNAGVLMDLEKMSPVIDKHGNLDTLIMNNPEGKPDPTLPLPLPAEQWDPNPAEESIENMSEKQECKGKCQ